MMKFFILIIFSISLHAQILDLPSAFNTLTSVTQGPVVACEPLPNQLEGLVRPEDRNAQRCIDRDNLNLLRDNEFRVMTWQDVRRDWGNKRKKGERYNPVTGQDRFYETGNYLLKRLPGNHYQTVLNLNIKPSITTLPPGTTEADRPRLEAELKQETLTKIKNCLASMQPHLRGPANETMEIRILTPEETNSLPRAMRPLPRDVTVSEANNDRGDAENFGTNFTCPTIGHELLHHMGLCDEYEEVDKGDLWSCRVIPVQTSFMKETHFAFDQIVPQTLTCDCKDNFACKDAMAPTSKLKNLFLSKDSEDVLEVNFYKKYCEKEPQVNDWEHLSVSESVPAPTSRLGFRSQRTAENGEIFVFERVFPNSGTAFSKVSVTCRCPAGDSYCQRMVNEHKSRIANPPMRTKCPAGAATLSHTFNSHTDATGLSGDILTIQNPGNGRSLLKPNHFRKLIAGDCMGRAPDYEKCAGVSNIPASSDKCVVPPECTSDSFFHGSTAH